MIIRISAIAALVALVGRPLPCSAFQPSPSSSSSIAARGSPPRLRNAGWSLAKAPLPLRMSSIPDDEDDSMFSSSSEDRFKFSLPPAPEDHVALGGDVVALFVYSYLDHIVNEAYAETLAKMDVADLVTYAANNPESTASLPVWFESAHLQTFGANWLDVSSIPPPYAPAIAVPGLAFVSLATTWLFCGYLSGAFMTRNTLECPPSRAMAVTLRTWAATALVMVALAYGSDLAWGALDEHINALSAPARGGLTKADADFIFDSLTVLAFWRFTLNWHLGYRR